MLGAWMSTAVRFPWIATMLAATGVIWAAVYMLWMLQRVVFGKVTNPANLQLKDLSGRELGLILPLLILMLAMGIVPRPFLDRSKASVEAVRVRRHAGGSFAGSNPASAPVEPADLSLNASEGDVNRSGTDQTQKK